MDVTSPELSSPVLALAEWTSLHAHLIWIYDGPVSARGRHGRVSAFDLTAWLIRQGGVEVRMGPQVWRAGEGEWLFPPPGEREQEFTEDARILSVRFRARWPTGEDLLPEYLGVKIAARRRPELLRTALPLARFVRRHFPAAEANLMLTPVTLAQHLRLQTLFSRWFETVVLALVEEGLVPTRMGRIDERLLAAVRRLDSQPFAIPISESGLARSAGLSVSQLNRLFRRQFGVSSRGYSEHRRCQQAVQALTESGRPIKELAGELGFSSLPHFSAWFRRKQGVSPREFRNSKKRVR